MEGLNIEYQIKLGKIKTDGNGHLLMNRADMREFMKGHTDTAIMVTLLSVIAWLMEDKEFEGSPDRLCDIFNNAERIITTVYDPKQAFGKKELAKVVEKGTGIKVRFYEE